MRSAASPRALGSGEIRSLTGLRGCAAVMVMLYHFSLSVPVDTLPLESLLHNGYLCVDLFFVLSGFVMAYSQTGLFDQFNDGDAVGQLVDVVGMKRLSGPRVAVQAALTRYDLGRQLRRQTLVADRTRIVHVVSTGLAPQNAQLAVGQ